VAKMENLAQFGDDENYYFGKLLYHIKHIDRYTSYCKLAKKASQNLGSVFLDILIITIFMGPNLENFPTRLFQNPNFSSLFFYQMPSSEHIVMFVGSNFASQCTPFSNFHILHIMVNFRGFPQWSFPLKFSLTLNNFAICDFSRNGEQSKLFSFLDVHTEH
jgi:hypothetical protein